MDQEIRDILVDSATLVKTVGPILEKQAALGKRAERVADLLIERGYYPLTKRAYYIQRLSDPQAILEELVKLASQIGPDSLAEPTNEITVASDPNEQLLNWILE